MNLTGIGEKTAAVLAVMGIEQIQDLWFHLPIRYQNKTAAIPIATLTMDDEYLIQGEVVSSNAQTNRRVQHVLVIKDTSASAQVQFFHISSAQRTLFAVGRTIRCFGKVGYFIHSQPVLVHPEIEISEYTPLPAKLTPVYPLTKGITQFKMRRYVAQALAWVDAHALEDVVGKFNRSADTDPPLHQHLQQLHFPNVIDDIDSIDAKIHPSVLRLALDELTAHQIRTNRLRCQQRNNQAVAFRQHANIKECIAALPFSLTTDQLRAWQSIAADLSKTKPMWRLLQGDVGSGKTIVATLACILAAANTAQAVIMVPTEILAEQHYLRIQPLLCKMGFATVLLTANIPRRERTIKAIASGAAQCVIGTQALLQPRVSYHKLCLVIIDELHRFGVEQRQQLLTKGKDVTPHQLIMSATPIPRTLAMAQFGDITVSEIHQLPPGRKTIQTALVHQNKRRQVIERSHKLCQGGQQVFWVCPLISENEDLNCQAAEKVFQELCVKLRPLRVGLLHGQMQAAAKQAQMTAFVQHSIDVLVATTVIEVGVDVANATLMIIENPERLGLSQLHQLRGRVGRGGTASNCVLLYGNSIGKNASERLQIMRKNSDGFAVARHDLRMRGLGDIVGRQQSGVIQGKVADLQIHSLLIRKAATLAVAMERQSPLSADTLLQRWYHHSGLQQS